MTPLDEAPEHTEAGYCDCCRGWTARGRVVKEIHSNSGPGAVVVRCAACVASPRQKHKDPTDPRTYSL